MLADDPVLMAMFPLGTVLFPQQLLPLQVFEPRYRSMMADVLSGARGLLPACFGVTLIERGSEVGGGDVRSRYGCVAQIVQTDQLADGRIAVVAAGIERIEVVDWLPDDPYPLARCLRIVDECCDAALADAAVARALALLTEVHATIGCAFDAGQWPSDVGAFADAIAYRFGFGAFDAHRVLREVGPLERLDLACAVLTDALDDARLRRSIQGEG